jgi:hypothetical protein
MEDNGGHWRTLEDNGILDEGHARDFGRQKMDNGGHWRTLEDRRGTRSRGLWNIMRDIEGQKKRHTGLIFQDERGTDT